MGRSIRPTRYRLPVLSASLDTRRGKKTRIKYVVADAVRTARDWYGRSVAEHPLSMVLNRTAGMDGHPIKAFSHGWET